MTDGANIHRTMMMAREVAAAHGLADPAHLLAGIVDVLFLTYQSDVSGLYYSVGLEHAIQPGQKRTVIERLSELARVQGWMTERNADIPARAGKLVERADMQDEAAVLRATHAFFGRLLAEWNPWMENCLRTIQREDEEELRLLAARAQGAKQAPPDATPPT